MARRRALFRVENPGELVRRFKNLSDVSNAETSKALRKGATEIQKLARKYAPVDRGNLEDAIKVMGFEKRGRAYASYHVGVDDSHPVPERPDKVVGDYALEMHESEYELGPKSQEKAERLGVEVGPKYLERAMEDLRDPLTKYMEKVLRDIVKRFK